jgi:superfamily II RNA helicase
MILFEHIEHSYQLYNYNKPYNSYIIKMSDTTNAESNYDHHYESFSFPLSPFQKQAIQAIVDGNHALVCAPTGSGKTLPAEFAIQHFVKAGKRVIYCSPIKALSNQKMYDFSKKYPEISFGLLTGDIKTNPGAQVLIMTTEILMNKLFLLTDLSVAETSSEPSASLTFDINLETDLGVVVFDEVHMINSPDRGHVWEKCIMMLPNHVQMVMLSATLDGPQKFANWVRGTGTKDVVLCQTHTRIVPLTHYTYLTTGEGFYKKLGDKEAERRARASIGKCLVLQDAAGAFNADTYRETAHILKLQFENRVFLKRKAVLNDLFAHLKAESMLPAIAFVFSRRNVEMCAQEITVPLLGDDADPYFIRTKCQSILSRLSNWHEYARMPEYETLVRLLERGIGIHHSGMIPVFREIVEFMIAEKQIRVLFATESFAIGLDCPIKTAIFVSLKKPDGGEHLRYLLPHEYTQMAGRAGRRGLDTVGNVIHCANLFDLPSTSTYKELLSGRPQTLTSKFKLYYPMILNWLSRTGRPGSIDDFVEFAEDSMLQTEMRAIQGGLEREIRDLEANHEGVFAFIQTPRETLAEYFDLESRLAFAANKRRKEIEAEMRRLEPIVKKDMPHYRKYRENAVLLAEKKKTLESNQYYIQGVVENLVSVLLENGILVGAQDDGFYELARPKGVIASRVAEIHPVLLANICPLLKQMESAELAGMLSLFTDVRVHEDVRIWAGFKHICDDLLLNDLLCQFNDAKEDLIGMESREGVVMADSGLEQHCYDIVDYVIKWCGCEDEAQCRGLIEQLAEDKGVSVGDFSKALLKISTISRELMAMCETVKDDSLVELAHKLSKIDSLVLKYVVTNQSLYL